MRLGGGLACASRGQHDGRQANGQTRHQGSPCGLWQAGQAAAAARRVVLRTRWHGQTHKLGLAPPRLIGCCRAGLAARAARGPGCLHGWRQAVTCAGTRLAKCQRSLTSPRLRLLPRRAGCLGSAWAWAPTWTAWQTACPQGSGRSWRPPSSRQQAADDARQTADGVQQTAWRPGSGRPAPVVQRPGVQGNCLA